LGASSSGNGAAGIGWFRSTDLLDRTFEIEIIRNRLDGIVECRWRPSSRGVAGDHQPRGGHADPAGTL
jgi:hypothetical protein